MTFTFTRYRVKRSRREESRWVGRVGAGSGREGLDREGSGRVGKGREGSERVRSGREGKGRRKGKREGRRKGRGRGREEKKKEREREKEKRKNRKRKKGIGKEKERFVFLFVIVPCSLIPYLCLDRFQPKTHDPPKHVIPSGVNGHAGVTWVKTHFPSNPIIQNC